MRKSEEYYIKLLQGSNSSALVRVEVVQREPMPKGVEIMGSFEKALFKISLGKADNNEIVEPENPKKETSDIEIPKLSIIQRLTLRLGGVISLGIQKPEGYKPMEFFLRRCRKHGIITTFPQGYLGKFRCRKCLEETRTRIPK